MEPSQLKQSSLSAGALRYVVSGALALLFTVAILIMMTKLILPFDDDPVVSAMRHDLELHRSVLPDEEEIIRVTDQLDELKFSEIPEIQTGEARKPRLDSIIAGADDSDPETNRRDQPQGIDLLETARAVIEEMENTKYRQWLEANSGKRKYVSIMQGPMPKSEGSREISPQGESVGSAYRSAYGDSEVIVSDNCVMQLRSTAYDYSDFSTKLPARISCKPPAPKIELSGLERRVAPPKLLTGEESAR